MKDIVFNHKVPVQLRFNDADALGHINNSVYIGNKSFTLVQRIVEVPTDTVKCICKTVMVGFDQATHESKPISEEWKSAISEYEHRLFS